jgi:hypothetical protein
VTGNVDWLQCIQIDSTHVLVQVKNSVTQPVIDVASYMGQVVFTAGGVSATLNVTYEVGPWGYRTGQYGH